MEHDFIKTLTFSLSQVEPALTLTKSIQYL